MKRLLAGGGPALAAFAAGLVLPGIPRIQAADTAAAAAGVVVLANADDPDSRRIARHYAAARSVPPENLIALPLPLAESITWAEFVPRLWNPLLDELVRRRWIDAIPMDLSDAVGRRKYAPSGHRITALVLCRGVPLKLEHDPALSAPVLPFTRRAEFRTNAGSVDGELSLLAQPNYPINAYVPNPLFRNARPAAAALAQIVKVTRLDGPAVSDVIGMIDRAIEVERTGLLGRAYVDLSDRDPVGDGWLEAVASQLDRMAFEVVVDRAPATFALTTRMDAPVLYFGWYTGEIGGPFTLPGFRFPPGAIALHIHSYSAHTLRSSTAGWAGPLVARGVTATFGNVHEPYLWFTHHADELLQALAGGATLAEAAYAALPAVSWQAVVIGDPLYRPFAVPLRRQLAPGQLLPAALAGYAWLRRIRELEAAAEPKAALEVAGRAQREFPGLALAWELASRQEAAGELDAAARTLGFVPQLRTFPADQWGLVAEIARRLESWGQPVGATATWRGLLGQEKLPRAARVVWLPEARRAALAARDLALADAWEREWEELTAPERK